MCIGHARLCVCLSVVACPHYCTDRDVTLRNGRECSIVVHCWTDLQSVHGFCCYNNIARTRNVSEVMYSLYAWFYFCSRFTFCDVFHFNVFTSIRARILHSRKWRSVNQPKPREYAYMVTTHWLTVYVTGVSCSEPSSRSATKMKHSRTTNGAVSVM